MPDKVTFSNQNVNIRNYALHHDDLEKSLRLYFGAGARSFNLRFAGYTPAEIKDELGARLDELNLSSTLTILTAVEAAFRIDYLQRCYGKKKDAVSREFRQLHKQKRDRVSLEDEIFDVWKKHTNGGAEIISNLIGAFKFRHWMAHGRYWIPKLGQKYDFDTVYALADSALNSFPLFR